jgi:hypothetical protein
MIEKIDTDCLAKWLNLFCESKLLHETMKKIVKIINVYICLIFHCHHMSLRMCASGTRTDATQCCHGSERSPTHHTVVLAGLPYCISS